MADHTTPGLMVGDTWWQQVLSYSIGRAADYEFAPRFAPSAGEQYGVDDRGRIYQRGTMDSMAGMASNPMVMVAVVVLAGSALYLLMRD